MGFGKRMLLLTDNTESKYQDRRGREHHENGDYAVRNNYGMGNMTMGYGNMEMGTDNMESRRRRDSRGRFRSEMEMDGGYGEMEMRRGGYGRSEMESRGGNQGGNMNEEMRGGYPYHPFPVYEERGRVNQIGFDPMNASEVNTNYRMNATHHTANEMEYRKTPQMGGYSFSQGMPMTKEMAEEWTRSMKNEDGTKGPHWTMEQVKQVMAQRGIKYEPAEFFAVLNAMYSDYCAVLKKHGINNIDVYIDLACAWLNDQDAVENKTAAYFQHVVKQ